MTARRDRQAILSTWHYTPARNAVQILIYRKELCKNKSLVLRSDLRQIRS